MAGRDFPRSQKKATPSPRLMRNAPAASFRLESIELLEGMQMEQLLKK